MHRASRLEPLAYVPSRRRCQTAPMHQMHTVPGRLVSAPAEVFCEGLKPCASTVLPWRR